MYTELVKEKPPTPPSFHLPCWNFLNLVGERHVRDCSVYYRFQISLTHICKEFHNWCSFKLQSHWFFEIMLLNCSWRKSATCWVCRKKKKKKNRPQTRDVSISAEQLGKLWWEGWYDLQGKGLLEGTCPAELKYWWRKACWGVPVGTGERESRDERAWERGLGEKLPGACNLLVSQRSWTSPLAPLHFPFWFFSY